MSHPDGSPQSSAHRLSDRSDPDSGQTPAAADWESCPPGTLARTVRGIEGRRRDRRRVAVAGLAGGILVILLAGGVVVSQFARQPAGVRGMGKMTCTAVKSLLPGYIAGSLDAGVMSQVKTHLEGCPHCREHYEKAQDDTAFPGSWNSPPEQLAGRF